MDELQIYVQTILDQVESLKSIEASLEAIGKQVTIPVSAELDIPKSLQQIRRGIESLEKLHVDLTGRLDRSESRKAIKKDLKALSNEQVAVKVKVDKAELKKSLKEAGAKATTIDVDTNVEGTEDLKKVSDGLDGIRKKSAVAATSVIVVKEAITELIQAGERMIKASAQLDEYLTDLRMVTGNSYEDASALVAKYNDLAKSLGATTKAVLEASSDWLRQGHDVSETNELIRDSMILSKVSELESADATEYLTSAMKGYKLAVEEVAGVVDKLTAVDLVSAVDAGGLAEAMSKTAVSANLAGVEMDRLIGYLAAVGEVTQDGMSSVGNALKTFFARYSDIKAGKLELIDEDGTVEALSDVEQSLKNVGIDMRSTITAFDDYDDTLASLAAKWDDLSNIQQSAIAKAFGGTRQKERFLVLMENYDKAASYMETAANSAGTAEKKFSAYLESLGAKIESFNAAFESLSMNTFDAQFMGGLVEAATALIEFIDGVNLLQAALVGLSTAGILKGFTMIANSAKNAYGDVLKLSTAFDIMGKAKGVGVTADQMQTLISVTKGLSESQLRLVVSNKALTNEQRMAILTSSGLTKEQAAQTLATMGLATAETTATAATFSLSGAMKALGAAIMANPIGFLATALTIAVSIIQTATDAAKEAKQALIETGKEAVQSAEDLTELINSYIELSYAVEEGTATQEELESVQDNLIASLQDHGVAVQNLTGDYQSLRVAMIEATQEALKTDISLAKASVNEMKQQSVDELVTWFGDNSLTSASGAGAVDALKYLQELGYSGLSVGTEGGTIVLPNSATWDITNRATFEEMVENYRYLEGAMNNVREKFGAENPVFKSLSSMYTAYNDALKDDLEMIDSTNELIASYELSELQLGGDPESLDEFKKFRSDLISATESDLDFDPMGGKSAEEIVDAVLSQNSAYKDLLSELQKQEATADVIAQKRQEILDKVATEAEGDYDENKLRFNLEDISDEELDVVYNAVMKDGITTWREMNLAISSYNAEQDYLKTNAGQLQTALSNLWNSVDFADTKEEIQAMAESVTGITPENVKDLAAESEDLAAILEMDGMNAQFLAHVLETTANGGNGFDLITNDALELNEILDGMIDSFDNVTAAKARYDAAMSVQEKDTNFKSYVEAFAELNAQFEAGTTNSNAFWAAAEFLFGSDQLAAWGWRDGLDEIYQAMESNRTIFEDAESAGAGFIDRLYEMSEAGALVNENGEKLIEITKTAEGAYEFNVEPEDITAIADAMNLTEEAVLACFQALSMWGNVNFYDIMDVVGKLKEMELIANTADGQAVNFSRLTEQLMALGKTDLEIADLTTALQNQGVTLLAVTDNVDTLTTNLQELGLAASDGVTITVDYEGLANLMSQIGFTKEETQNLITTLGTADGISLANASGEVQGVTDALAYIDTLTFDIVTTNIGGVSAAIGDVNESSTDNAVSELSAVGSAADTAASKVYNIGNAIDSINGRKATVYFDVQRTGNILGMFGFAKGTKDAPAGEALVGEEGVELWQSGDKARLVGVNGPEIVNLNKGDKIYPNPMTKKMMSKSGKRLSGTIPAYALGLNVRPYAVAMNDGGGSGGSSKKTETTVASAVAAAVSGAISGAVNAAKGAVSGSVDTSKNKTGSTGSNKSNSSGDGSGGSGSSNSSSGDGFEEQYKEHQHLLAMDQESIEDYLAWLNQAYKDAYANGEIELDDYYKYQEEVYSKLQDLFKDYLSDTEHQIDMMSNYEGSDAEIISMYQELMKAIEKEIAAARAAGLDDSDDYIQELQKKWMDFFGKVADIQEEVTDKAKDATDELVDFRIDMLKQELEARRDALNTQLDDLKDFYDEQKDMLQEQYDHEKYLEEQAEKRRSVADIQTQLEQLRFDDSAWAQKRKLELQEELSAAQKDLSDFERDNSLDEAMRFLDAQYEQQELLIQEEIAAIEAQLNDPAALYNQALNDIKNNTKELYEQMVEYNNKYGDGNPETVKEMWENAYVALKEYIDLFGEAYKDIALNNATDYKEPDDSWDTNPVSGTNPDNQVTQPTTPSTPKEEEKKSSAPSLEKGSTITVKKSATHFSSKSGSVRMASFVPGGKYTVYQTSGNEVLIGRDGVYTGWIKKTDIVGYASGTKYASAGFHRFDERGSEYIFSDQGGEKYRLFSSGEKVLDAESANFLYDFASKKGVGIVDKIIAGIFGSADSIADRIAGSAYGSKENLSRAMRSVTDNRVINNNVDMSGDINIQGNASEKTVSDMRREKREMIEYVLKELNRMGAEEVRRVRR